MDRRQFISAIAAMSGSVAATSVVASVLSNKTPKINTSQLELTAHQQKVISTACEVIIPETDTPGAIAAGVPDVVINMVSHWLSKAEQDIFVYGLANLGTLSLSRYKQRFTELNVEQQTELLETLESEAANHPWYQLGNVQRDFVADAPFICQLKELTIFAFYNSEKGSTQVLRANPMGIFDGDIELGPQQSSWSQQDY